MGAGGFLGGYRSFLRDNVDRIIAAWGRRSARSGTGYVAQNPRMLELKRQTPVVDLTKINSDVVENRRLEDEDEDGGLDCQPGVLDCVQAFPVFDSTQSA